MLKVKDNINCVTRNISFYDNLLYVQFLKHKCMKKNNLTLNGYMSIKFASTLQEGVDCLLSVCIEAGAPIDVQVALNDAASKLGFVLREFRKACGSFDGVKRDQL